MRVVRLWHMVPKKGSSCPTPGSVQDQVGWGLEQTEIVEDVTVHDNEVGMRWYLRSLSTQTILRFHELFKTLCLEKVIHLTRFCWFVEGKAHEILCDCPTCSSRFQLKEEVISFFVSLISWVNSLRTHPALDEPTTQPPSLVKKIDPCLLLSKKRIMMIF